MDSGKDLYTKLLAKRAADVVATLYLGLFFGSIFGAAIMFIFMQQR